MTTTTANLLQKYVIMREVSIIGITLSQWSDFTFTWMNITFWAHYGLKHSLYSNMYVLSDSVDMKHPSFLFFFIFIVISRHILVSCQVSLTLQSPYEYQSIS